MSLFPLLSWKIILSDIEFMVDSSFLSTLKKYFITFIWPLWFQMSNMLPFELVFHLKRRMHPFFVVTFMTLFFVLCVQTCNDTSRWSFCGFTYLGVAHLNLQVGLCLSPNLEVFSHYFLKTLSTPSSSSSLYGTPVVECWIFWYCLTCLWDFTSFFSVIFPSFVLIR